MNLSFTERQGLGQLLALVVGQVFVAVEGVLQSVGLFVGEADLAALAFVLWLTNCLVVVGVERAARQSSVAVEPRRHDTSQIPI